MEKKKGKKPRARITVDLVCAICMVIQTLIGLTALILSIAGI